MYKCQIFVYDCICDSSFFPPIIRAAQNNAMIQRSNVLNENTEQKFVL